MDPSFAGDYADLERWHWWFRGRRRILGTILERELGPVSRDGLRMLVVGSGPPSGLGWLLPYCGDSGRIVSLDADPSGALREAARGNAASEPDRVAFVVGDMRQPPFQAQSFDVLLALDVLEHVDDDAGALAEACAQLRPGGLVLLTVPALPALWGNQDLISHHRRRYTRRQLEETCRRAGLAAPRIRYFNGLLLPAVAAVRLGRRVLGRVDATRSDFDGAQPGLTNDLLTRLFGAERHWVRRRSLFLGSSLLALGFARAPAPRTESRGSDPPDRLVD